MAIIHEISQLSEKCISSGWDVINQTIPTGKLNLRDYFEFNEYIIPVDDILEYDYHEDELFVPFGYSEIQMENILRNVDELKKIGSKFIDKSNNIILLNGFQIEE